MSDTSPRIRTWVRGSDAEIRTGLIGYVSVEFGGLVLDGIVVRKTTDGRFTLSFPARTDRAGRKHPYIRPVSDQVRKEIEDDLLWQLGEREDFAA